MITGLVSSLEVVSARDRSETENDEGSGALEPSNRKTYGVKLVRGPFVRLSPHADHCADENELRSYIQRVRLEEPNVQLAADLFSGAGGLSLGLSRAGVRVVFSADYFPEAVETHKHHFPGLSVDWDLADPAVVEKIASLMTDMGIEVLVGGPPCQPFSKAGRSKIRHRVYEGLRDPYDERRDLWRSFLEIVRLARPQAVLMENVPDMALDQEMFILRAAVEELEDFGYSVRERVIDTWKFGVPQFRQRLIMVGIHGSRKFHWPVEATTRHTVWNAIGDLPEVEGGWRPEGGAEGWTAYLGPSTSFQLSMRDGVPAGHEARLYDHITRPVREDDALAFEAMDSNTRYSDLPASVKRYREDIFDDKYKRLDENNVSRTITAHIAKDGYWYIHPRQNRTLTVREAARLQTFPDWYRFAGPPSAAFRQIGNAVPPLLAELLGGAVLEALHSSVPSGVSSQQIASSIAGWFQAKTRLARPWLRSTSRWQVVQAELLLDRATVDRVRMIWPMLDKWAEPWQTLKDQNALREIGGLIGRSARVERLLLLADWLKNSEGALERLEKGASQIPGLGSAVADLAVLVVAGSEPGESDEPVLATKGVLRVASRYFGEPVDKRNRLTDGRLAVARMIGGGVNARDAHKGLIELAASTCRPADTLCSHCPLVSSCASAQNKEDDVRLF